MPTASVARTSKLWLPAVRFVYALGELQEAKVPPSRLHWKVDPTSVEVKLKLAAALLVGLAGVPGSPVSGARVSMVQAKEVGVAIGSPVCSFDCTVKLWLPSARLS